MHIGSDMEIADRYVVAVLNCRRMAQPALADLLSGSAKSGGLVALPGEPKSCVVTHKNGYPALYLSPIGPTVLRGRQKTGITNGSGHSRDPIK